MRLDKLLEQAELGSRKQVKRLLVMKQVKVDNVVVTVANQNIDLSFQKVTVGQKEITGRAHVYYMLNKPQGVVSAVRDAQHQTVLDLLKPEDRLPGMFPVGRLDRDTEGLLLLTDNGKLSYELLQPKKGVTKEYEAVVNERVTTEDVAAFAAGIVFHGGEQCLPAQLTIVTYLPEGTLVRLRITEGKFHQVKKMFLAVGKKVIYLKRLKMGNLSLDEVLAVGEYRQLSVEELQKFREYF
ncbi:16S rRNA pseudouridine(516) synthase [Vagococcus salmoninarum]|uniref:16S rRNA pseudouridine(516) synthase n=1 Tax=Vagococcus salmoninarum TaxID=2739 RepID=UPI003F9BE266